MGKRKVKHESEDDEDEDFLDTMIEAAPKAKKAKAAFKKASRKKVKGEDGEPVEKRLAIVSHPGPATEILSTQSLASSRRSVQRPSFVSVGSDWCRL
jgi:hypothetical protein